MRTTVLLAVAMLAWCAGARAGGLTLYVAPDGNDAWTGKSAEARDNDGPFATLARARDAIRERKAQGGLKEPVTVRIRGGTYFLSETLTFTPEDSGTKECPISYEAAAGERPVLCGGKRITGWRRHRGKIRVARIPEVQAGTWHFRSLFADGVRQPRARYPNVEPSDPYRKGFLYADRKVQGNPLSASGTTSGSCTQFWYAAGTFKPSWVKAREAEIHVFQSGSCRAFKEIVSLVKVDEKERCVTIGGPECVVPILSGDRYFVENVFEELDSPGEWYLNRETGQLFYRPQADFTETTEVIAPVLGRVIQVLGNAAEKKTVSHLTFSGLAFEATAYTPDDGCIGYDSGNDGVVYLKDATQCAIENCAFRAIGKYAVCLSGGGANAISGNDISGGAEGGVLLLNSGGNTVSDNHIHHCGHVYKHIGGVVLGGGGASDNLIAHNMIHDVPRYGISLKNAGTTNRIEYNRILNTNLETYDSGGIEVTQNEKHPRSGSVIRNNVVGDTIGYSADGPKSVFLAWGIYLDSYASDYTVTHNITYRSSHGGVMLQGGKDNRIENNIFVDSAFSQAYIRNYDNHSTGQVLQRNIFRYAEPNALLFACGRLDEKIIRINSNLYFNISGKEPIVRGCASLADWQKLGFDRDSLIADPRFVDPASDHYALQADSPALTLGFQPIDTSQVGLLRGRCRCSIRPAALDFGLTGTGVGTRTADPSLVPGFD